MNNLERFINYAKIDTQADDKTNKTPSTEKQKNLGRLLVKELKELGLEDAHMDEYGNVYAHLKGEGDKIGLNAHMDTALEVSNENTNPRIIKNYDGSDIKLNEEHTLSIKQFPSLKNAIGSDIVVTDGNTLLGADDKAGIAIIMGALQYFYNHREIKHHNISIAFTVDEEIGEGTRYFNYEKMDADYGFTIDGSNIDCADYENFNAYKAVINAKGVSIHPGEGKGQLVNAIVLINNVLNALPQLETPYDAEYDKGYWHVTEINGTNEEANCEMILRDFDGKQIQSYINCMQKTVNELNNKYPRAKLTLITKEQYLNMLPYVKKDPRPVNKANEALIKNGLTPRHTKIRGGTDGASMSRNGLVTPNLGTGSYNHHGRYEYLIVNEFNKMIDIVIDILKI